MPCHTRSTGAMALRASWVIIVIFAQASPAYAADDGDDFSNNLFTDLAPLLALFGEQFARQYLSQSMGWLDHVIFAMGPLGILMAVVSAIRVKGPPWLRAVIGRARENRATVELELLSSTSHEVCELWNGTGVVRTIGKPMVKEIIYLEEFKDDPVTHGLFTVDSALKGVGGQKAIFGVMVYRDFLIETSRSLLKYFLRKTRTATKRRSPKIPPPSTAKINSFPSVAIKGLHAAFTSSSSVPRYIISDSASYDATAAPNISLNLHYGASRWELVAFAVFGVMMQSGVVAFTASTVYHPTFKNGFKKSGDAVEDYAFPLFALGTVVLSIGLILCSAMVERASKEERFVGTNGKRLDARILWIQKKHNVGDQNFDAHILFGRNKRKEETLKYVLSSRRAEGYAQQKEKGGAKGRLQWVKGIASNVSEAVTIVSALMALVGFVLQFQGLRGLNWFASIAQLVCIAVMTLLRAFIRRHLIATPNAVRVPEEYELDWLALKLGASTSPDPEESSGATRGDANEKCDFWPDDEPINPDLRPRWMVVARPGSLSAREPINPPLQTQSPAQRTLRLRQRLGQLTQWRGPASREARALARCIETFMNTLVDLGERRKFTWALDVRTDTPSLISLQSDFGSVTTHHIWGSKTGVVKFTATRQEFQEWTVDATELEAALSLWMFHISEMEEEDDNQISSTMYEKDWLSYKASNIRWAHRHVFPPATGGDEARVRRRMVHLDRWMRKAYREGSTMTSRGQHKVAKGLPEEAIGPVVDTRTGEADGSRPTTSYTTRSNINGKPNNTTIVHGSLVSLLAQHLFTNFVWSVGKYVDPIRFDCDFLSSPDELETSSPETWAPSLSDLELEDRSIKRVAEVFTAHGLGSTEDALYCMIPIFSHLGKLPITPIINLIRQKTETAESHGDWSCIIEAYRYLMAECTTLDASHPDRIEGFAILLHVYEAMRSLQTRCRAFYGPKRVGRWDYRPDFEQSTMIADLRQYLTSPAHMHHLRHFGRLSIYQGRRKNPPIWMELLRDATFPCEVIKLPALHDFFRHDRSLVQFLQKIYNLRTSSRGAFPVDDYPVEHRDALGWTPVHYLAALGTEPYLLSVDLANLKTQIAWEINRRDISGRTALQYAIELSPSAWNYKGPRAQNRMVYRLLDCGALPGVMARDGTTPLHFAVRTENVDAIHLLLSHDSSPSIDAKNDLGHTALHIAASIGSVECVSLLVQRNAARHIQDKLGRTALHLAARTGNHKVVLRLLGDGALGAANVVDQRGSTPLHLAAETGSVDVLKTLVQYNADIEKEDFLRRTPLIVAATFGQIEFIRHLLDHCDAQLVSSTPEGKDDEWRVSALHAAAIHGQFEVVKLLADEYRQYLPLTALATIAERPMIPISAALFSRDTKTIRLLSITMDNPVYLGEDGFHSLQLPSTTAKEFPGFKGSPTQVASPGIPQAPSVQSSSNAPAPRKSRRPFFVRALDSLELDIKVRQQLARGQEVIREEFRKREAALLRLKYGLAQDNRAGSVDKEGGSQAASSNFYHPTGIPTHVEQSPTPPRETEVDGERVKILINNLDYVDERLHDVSTDMSKISAEQPENEETRAGGAISDDVAKIPLSSLTEDSLIAWPELYKLGDTGTPLLVVESPTPPPEEANEPRFTVHTENAEVMAKLNRLVNALNESKLNTRDPENMEENGEGSGFDAVGIDNSPDIDHKLSL